MRINHNIQALNAYRNLSQTMGQTSKSLEKLSSGLRINRAADDAAGLAISEKMRSQIRGLEMAERNTLDAISLIQTGEGALNQTHEILQRMRELSVQAGNGTLEDQDRQAIQNEIDQLTFEIDRIADTTQFNQKKLLSGSEKGIAFADANSGQIQYTGDNRFEGLVVAEPTSPAQAVFDFDKTFANLDKADLNGKTFKINGETYEIDIDDSGSIGIDNGNIAIVLDSSVWNDNPSDEAAMKGNLDYFMTQFKSAIEKSPKEFSVAITPAADADPAVDDLTSGKLTLTTLKDMSPKEADTMKIDVTNGPDAGVKVLDPTDPAGTGTATSFVADKSAGDAQPVSLQFNKVPEDGDELKIDELVITFNSDSSDEYSYDGSQGTVTINTDGKDLFAVLNEVNSALGKAKLDDVNDLVPSLSSHEVVGNTLIVTTDRTDDGKDFEDAFTNGLEIGILSKNYEANKNKALELDMQIGANDSEVLTFSLGVMDAAKLGLARRSDGTYLTTGVNAERGVDVTSTEAARMAITRIDEAIRLVSEERSKLGAIQNRLEHTTTNLQTANENLTSAESRIRDADMAKEMTTFTKNNILNQAGQAMLAQANQLPQGILQLLK
jgi:flagellin